MRGVRGIYQGTVPVINNYRRRKGKCFPAIITGFRAKVDVGGRFVTGKQQWDTERLAAIEVDKILITHGLAPVNILKPISL
jgi:hypothetical protein